MSMSNILKALIDEGHGNLFAKDIASAQPGILEGLSHAQGKQVMEALDVKTVAELATSRYVLWAQAVTHLAKQETTNTANPGLTAILDPSWQRKRLRDIAKASPLVFAGLSEKDARLLNDALGVRTVEELATNVFILKAQVIAHLATFEKIQSFKKAA